jgi:hypothetical protein
MFVLTLNDMRDAHYEDLSLVCTAPTKEELEAFLEREKVEPYKGEGPNTYRGSIEYSKTFREGGPLEWFNSPSSVIPCIHEVVTIDEFIGQAADYARQDYKSRYGSVPKLCDL